MSDRCLSSSYSLTTFLFYFFFFNDPATTEIYTLSLHDALPISVALLHRRHHRYRGGRFGRHQPDVAELVRRRGPDRKSTRLNSSHVRISYAVFCLKKKKKKTLIISVNDDTNNTYHNTSSEIINR